MKTLLFVVALLIVKFSLFAQGGAKVGSCLAKADAEKIIGQPSRLVESKSTTNNGVGEVRCTFMAIEADSKTGKRVNLYYRLVEYSTAEQAHDTLQKFDNSNKNNAGWTRVTGIGDEAISHTDKENFQLVIIRKRNKMVFMKVNKITAFTAPLDTLLAVGEMVANKF
jgi:hypothetical protein